MAQANVDDNERERTTRGVSGVAASGQRNRLPFFTPHAADAEARRCRYCAHWAGAVPGGVACGLVRYVNAGGFGCAFFEREAGSDDDLAG